MATKTKKTAKKAVKTAVKKTNSKVKVAKKPAKKAPPKAKVAPKKAVKAAKPEKTTKSLVEVKALRPGGKSHLVAKPIGTKARPMISPNKGKVYNKRKNGVENIRPERAADIPVRTIKVVQPKIKISTQDPGKTRYSDEELHEFKVLIDEKLEAAKNELRYLQDQINRKDDNGTDDTENKFANLEDGSITMEREYLNQMAVRQAQYIDHLEKALMRIQNKTYGICRVTGKLIDKERLRAVPHATLSMEAKLMQNR